MTDDVIEQSLAFDNGARQSNSHLDEVDPSLLVELISTLRKCPPDHRLQIVEAALTFLGTPVRARLATQAPAAAERADDTHVSMPTLPRRAENWLAQSGLQFKDLENVFHFDYEKVEVIAHMVPGTSTKERVRSCYLLCGIRELMKTGEPRFSDEDAREICREMGSYDPANHSTSVKGIGSLVLGSKSGGYQLTAPGLKAAAETIRQMLTL